MYACPVKQNWSHSGERLALPPGILRLILKSYEVQGRRPEYKASECGANCLF